MPSEAPAEAGVVVVGLAQCDGCRRARRWLEGRGVAWRFHDLRADGVDAQQIAAWADDLGASTLLNRRSRTWRELDPARREGLDDAGIRALLQEDPRLIRRPLLLIDGRAVTAGFDEARWARWV
jgi:Spx/MgsR family transcriptional regulator